MGKEHVLVADVMKVDPIVVSLEATLDEADMILRATYVTGLPVVDGGGVLVGVIGHEHLAAHRFGGRMSSSQESSAKSAPAR
jgi:CBS domain-containing protein